MARSRSTHDGTPPGPPRVTEARGQDDRPQRPRVGEPGPAWAGDGELPDDPALADRIAVDGAAAVAASAAAPAVGGEVEPAVGPVGLELAGFGRRFLGFGVDYAITLVLLIVLNAVLGLDPGLMSDGEQMLLSLGSILGRFGYWWVWNTVGWSPGKRAVGLRIVNSDGAAPGLESGFRRAVMSLVSELLLFAGYLWALRDARNQTWHDKAGGTFVVVAPAEDQRP